jgi:hypothetical protein
LDDPDDCYDKPVKTEEAGDDCNETKCYGQPLYLDIRVREVGRTDDIPCPLFAVVYEHVYTYGKTQRDKQEQDNR